MNSLLQELIKLTEDYDASNDPYNTVKGLGDPSYYKVKNITEYTDRGLDDGKPRIKFRGYKKRRGRFVFVGYFTAPGNTPEDELWKKIDDHFHKFDDGYEDD